MQNHSNKILLDRYIPITDWLSDYSLSNFNYDIRAGRTVGILLIPQSIAYALLATYANRPGYLLSWIHPIHCFCKGHGAAQS